MRRRGTDAIGPVKRWRRAWQVRPAALVRAVGDAHASLRCLDDYELRYEAFALRTPLRELGLRDALIGRAFALVREAARRTLGQPHHDEQLIGGRALLAGLVADIDAGEGKTLTATLAAATAALGGTPVHVVSASDHLAARDAQWMGPVYGALGLTVGVVVHGMERDARRDAHRADVTYCTARQVALDYLRDRVLLGARDLLRERALQDASLTRDLVLRGLHFAIVDDADSVLVDEARTSVAISAPGDGSTARRMYEQALELAGCLKETDDFAVDALARSVDLTERGRIRLDELVRPLGGPWRDTQRREALMRHALEARHLYHRDTHYRVHDSGRVVVVDELTGRRVPRHAWRHEVHALIAVKEGVPLVPGSRTLARLNYQRLFQRYRRLAGMSATAREAASELSSIYGLGVMRVPPRVAILREELPATLHVTAADRWAAVVSRAERIRRTGRPVLIGTRSTTASEELRARLHAAGLEHRVVLGRDDAADADILRAAGQLTRVTVITNAAGRGTDIPLAPGVAERGGLHVIATEYHDARRMDQQLAQRCGRRGEPGTFEVIASLEDEVVVRHGGWWRHVARWIAGRSSRVPPQLARWLVTRAQRRAERLHGRMRADLLRLDRRIESALASPDTGD